MARSRGRRAGVAAFERREFLERISRRELTLPPDSRVLGRLILHATSSLAIAPAHMLVQEREATKAPTSL